MLSVSISKAAARSEPRVCVGLWSFQLKVSRKPVFMISQFKASWEAIINRLQMELQKYDINLSK